MQYKTLEDVYLQEIKQVQFEKDLLCFKQSQNIRKILHEQAKANVDQKYQKSNRELQALRKIKKSSIINEMRMKKCRIKYQLCQQIFTEVLKRLSNVSEESDSEYQLMLLNYIVEGCISLFEEQVKIHVLQKDVQLVKVLIPEILKSFQYFMVESMGRQFPLKLYVVENDCLAQRQLTKNIGKQDENRTSVGGVILSDSTGNIVYKNTFDTRLNILKESIYPVMIDLLWGQGSK